MKALKRESKEKDKGKHKESLRVVSSLPPVSSFPIGLRKRVTKYKPVLDLLLISRWDLRGGKKRFSVLVNVSKN